MGHREDLLEGAKRCLYEKGYARTTARDIVAASGTNLGSIGYHFGSKEALLNTALIEAMRDMAREFTRLSAEDLSDLGWEDMATGWTRVVGRFDEYRPLLVSQIEAWAQAERSEELRTQLAEHYQQEITHGATLTRQYYDTPDDRTAWAVSAVITALADGLVLQWLIDPGRAPSGRDVATALRAVARAANRSEHDTDKDSSAES
ncbi:TetR/AcrR family transcriptional regulator [Phytoactinopolyspora halotolerans]|uniref:TetR/AcrR family transcriptional regulator n=1 Tax=Phytoactinopolyspora halotolerans TaxID=1981512 RepID=A0A6L9SDD9_9ACTN|nr:TetR/AcrR family transcriptional regulator [Phytoactinopolyspora halotolerans]NEE02582.1 TetR/AcrR family transcriptional regulator [Phytoactinopolyspora halotolerans]